MYGTDICMVISDSYKRPLDEQIVMLKGVGFDGFFVGWECDHDLVELRRVADENEMLFQSVHAPFGMCGDIWSSDTEKAESGVATLIKCLDDCHEAGVKLVISHAFIGFDRDNLIPNEIGLERYGRFIDHAEKLGITIAFENTEREEFLDAIFQRFGDRANVGYCWDSGHEMCYNGSRDFLAKYGARLLGTHLNDNLGVKSKTGEITWLDDLHLLPYDGIADWQYNMHRLKNCGFDGPLTFELNIESKPDRHENDKYGEMPLEQYFAEVYARACRLAREFRK